ncbi:hypothetical protein IQ265_27870 [Nodosilinea sp. LEGE 06152]|uniref:baeRF7 domain-containing protein n=1 Tax=Nodosilinea sp. LEGE 06152 TaxID=2777966 RepID=UPI001882040A|nr:hypothetical protein [Nodosilinea sp. LEGE 06152]MBE9160610.1 hypothetical protein [Nodosilinea sp. LEGE 06152]
MPLLSQSEFKRLSQSASDYSASIYLPTHVAGPEIQQDPIRLKNLLGEAETKLLEAGLDKRGGQQLLQPGFDLLEDDGFWRHQSQGLALFLTTESMELYRLPLEFESLVVVGDRFHLKPLLPLFSSDRYFYLLALSQNQVRLFQATRYHISEVTLERVPTSLDEALRYDDPEAQLHFHNVSGSGSVPNYHGHGVGTDDNKDNIRRFLRTVNEGLHPYLNQEDAPLVIASVDYLQPIYREVNTYPHLLEDGVSGNPDEAKPEDLRQAAWEKVAGLLEESQQQAVVHYNNLKSTDQASDRLPDLLPAACRGQVDVLFTKANAHCWGQFDFNSGQLQQHDQPQPHDQDLLDLAAVQTFLQGGTVYVLDEEAMPTQTPAAAVYRYTLAT